MTKVIEHCGGSSRSTYAATKAGAWRLARSIGALFHQISEAFPDRDRSSDGTICNPDNHDPGSDHCPHDFPGWGNSIVTAGDFDHDPAHGADMGCISEQLRLSRDRRIAYVIFNRRIFSATIAPWQWRPYSGPSPHTGHMHVSVVHTSIADNDRDWRIDMPLTDDDVRRVSIATAAKVLGRPWITPGRTLAGSTEAILSYLQGFVNTLAEILRESVNDGQVTPEQAELIAQKVRERMPTGGTFTLTSGQSTPTG